MINQKMKPWIIFALATLGLAHAVYLSLPILDASSSLFRNDEGYYLKNGANGVFLAELRYGLFSLLVKVYFLIFREPFWVVVFHKWNKNETKGVEYLIVEEHIDDIYMFLITYYNLMEEDKKMVKEIVVGISIDTLNSQDPHQ